MSGPLLARPAVEKYVGLSRSAIYRLMETGEFPRPLRMPGRGDKSGGVRWRQVDLDEWIDSLEPAET